jgi:predicted nucleic acid-binding protein
LFDIWIANEDRNHNNYNLLIDIEDQRNLVPIDHEAIFNSRSLNSPIYELSYEDSLISSPLFTNLLSENDFSKLILDEIKEIFYKKVGQCKDNSEEIIGRIPNDWRIIKKDLEIKLFNELFVDNWFISSFNLFLQFLQLNINSRKCNRTLA